MKLLVGVYISLTLSILITFFTAYDGYEKPWYYGAVAFIFGILFTVILVCL